MPIDIRTILLTYTTNLIQKGKKMFIKKIFLLGLCLCFLEMGFSEEPGKNQESEIFSFKLSPGLTLPVGEDSEYFNLGFYSDLITEIRIPNVPLLYFPIGVGYSYIPINSDIVELNLMLLRASGGVGIDWNPTGDLHIGAYTRFGYTYGFIPDTENQLEQNVVNPTNTGQTWNMTPGAFIQYRLLPAMSLGVEVAFPFHAGLYSGFEAALGLTYHLLRRPQGMDYQPTKPKLDLLKISEINLNPVFPVLYKYYDDHSFGTISVENTGTKTIEKIQVSFFVKEYMDNPKECGAIEKLKPGDVQQVDIYGLFNSRVLDISESTKVSANLIINSKYDGTEYQNESIQSLRLYDRNAVTWEDDRRAAAFVTMKDPTVLKLSKFVSGQIKDKASKSLNQKFLSALGMIEALRLYEISYVTDPSTPYKDFSKQPMAVDYLQFPIQTLEYKAGDCDDLSILYCALLESIGIRTAFVTVPGHIFMAVDLEMKPLEAQKQFSEPENLIFLEGNTWLPVEVTLVRGGFLTCWREGARQWREYSPSNQTGFFPIHKAWELYEPVGFSSEAEDIALPPGDRLSSDFLAEVNKFVEKEIYARVEVYRERIRASNGKPRDINRLGVLFARYGKKGEAKAEFNKVLAVEEYVPALVNLGNLSFQEGNYEEALTYYERAYNRENKNAAVVLSLARTHHEMENYSYVKKFYRQLKQLSSSLAERFSYLELRREELARAADIAGEKEIVLWEE
jgi:hypothetical protein